MKKQCQRLLLAILILFMAACKQLKTEHEPTGETALQIVEKACMDKIMALDDSLGTVRNHACKTISLSETIKQYTEAIGEFDDRDCPGAFAEALEKQREAWFRMLEVTDKYPELRGEMHDLFKEIEAVEDAGTFASLLQLIQDSRVELEKTIKAQDQ